MTASMPADLSADPKSIEVRYRWTSDFQALGFGLAALVFGVWVLKGSVLGVAFKDMDIEDLGFSALAILGGPVVMGMSVVSMLARVRTQLTPGLELLIDDRGLHHYILGTIPWTEVQAVTYTAMQEDHDKRGGGVNASASIELTPSAFARLSPHISGIANLFIRLQVGYSAKRQALSLRYSAPWCDPMQLAQRVRREAGV
jgi:hypothetical protein